MGKLPILRVSHERVLHPKQSGFALVFLKAATSAAAFAMPYDASV